jgi:hypothetical protein
MSEVLCPLCEQPMRVRECQQWTLDANGKMIFVANHTVYRCQTFERDGGITGPHIPGCPLFNKEAVSLDQETIRLYSRQETVPCPCCGDPLEIRLSHQTYQHEYRCGNRYCRLGATGYEWFDSFDPNELNPLLEDGRRLIAHRDKYHPAWWEEGKRLRREREHKVSLDELLARRQTIKLTAYLYKGARLPTPQEALADGGVFAHGDLGDWETLNAALEQAGYRQINSNLEKARHQRHAYRDYQYLPHEIIAVYALHQMPSRKVVE